MLACVTHIAKVSDREVIDGMISNHSRPLGLSSRLKILTPR